MIKELITVEEAAGILKIRQETVRRYIQSGYLKAYALPGGDYRISAEAIEELLTRPPDAKTPVS